MSARKKVRRTPSKKAVRTRKAKGTITYRLTVGWGDNRIPDGAVHVPKSA